MEIGDIFKYRAERQEAIKALEEQRKQELQRERAEQLTRIVEGVSRQALLQEKINDLINMDYAADMVEHPPKSGIDRLGFAERGPIVYLGAEEERPLFVYAYLKYEVDVKKNYGAFNRLKSESYHPSDRLREFGLVFYTEDSDGDLPIVEHFKSVRDWDDIHKKPLGSLTEKELTGHFSSRVPEELTLEYQTRFSEAIDMVMNIAQQRDNQKA